MKIDKNYQTLSNIDKNQWLLEWNLRDYYLMSKHFNVNNKTTKCLTKYFKFMRLNGRFDEAIEYIDYLNQYRIKLGTNHFTPA